MTLIDVVDDETVSPPPPPDEAVVYCSVMLTEISPPPALCVDEASTWESAPESPEYVACARGPDDMVIVRSAATRKEVWCVLVGDFVMAESLSC